MTLHAPIFMQPGEYSAEELRQGLIPVLGDPGVIATPSLKVTQRAAGANMSVDVAAGRCIIAGVSGSYICRSDAVENVTITAAPSVGNSRIDLVYAKVVDAQAEDSGSGQEWVVDVVAGTPSSSPVAPALPDYSIELARITLTDATTSITNGIIADGRRQSASFADRVWPLKGLNAPANADDVDSTVESWGIVTIPAPNRQVYVEADADCYAVCATGEILGYASLAIRITHSGSTSDTSTPVRALSYDDVHEVALSRTHAATFTPDPGTDIVVVCRIQSAAGGDVDFRNGRLRVRVFPA